MNPTRFICLAFLSAAILAVPTLAKPKIEGSIPLKGKSKSEYSSLAKISLQEATAIALKQVPGKIVEAALEKEDGFLVYEVDVLTESRDKKEFLIDAGTGKVLLIKDPTSKDDDEND